MEGHTLLGIGSELVWRGCAKTFICIIVMYPHLCIAYSFIKTNRRREVESWENIYLEDVTCKDTEYLVGLDMDILYQWRELVPTYEERLTPYRGIHVKDIRCGSADFVYELCGDEGCHPRTLLNIVVDNSRESPIRAIILPGLTLDSICYSHIRPDMVTKPRKKMALKACYCAVKRMNNISQRAKEVRKVVARSPGDLEVKVNRQYIGSNVSA